MIQYVLAPEFIFITYFIFILLTMNYLAEKNIITETIFLFIVIPSLVYIVIMGIVLSLNSNWLVLVVSGVTT